jgi:mannose-6-phosphate isomerase-like protein (cupin superfamily)
MQSQRLEQSPRNHRGGQVSYLLLDKGQFGSQNLTITWVEGAPESQQSSHSHNANEQAYVMVRGRGLMMVGDESQEVGPGTVIFVPPNTKHSIKNIGEEPLLFIGVTSPPLDIPAEGGGYVVPASP